MMMSSIMMVKGGKRHIMMGIMMGPAVSRERCWLAAAPPMTDT